MISKATTFTSPRQISLPVAQYAIMSGDLNNDGIPDLIIGGDPIFPERGKIRVGLGFGNGNFSSWREYEIGYNPNFLSAPFVDEIKIADFNNDGMPDVAVTHNTARSQFSPTELLATVLFGTGQGVLQPAQSYRFFDATPDNFVDAMTIADLNADGKLDIVVGVGSGNLGKLYFMKNLRLIPSDGESQEIYQLKLQIKGFYFSQHYKARKFSMLKLQSQDVSKPFS